MSTVAQLIDRILRDYLAPPDEQPTRFTLGAAIASTSVASFTVDTDFLSPEESALLGPGTLVEIEQELIQIGAYDESTNVASSCIRGVQGTTAATHLNGSQGLIAPKYSRRSVFDAIADDVEQLFPDLARTAETTSLSFSATSYTEVAATVMEPMYVWARPTGSASNATWNKYPVTFLDHFPASSTGKAALIPSLNDGSVSGYLVYKGKFTRPTAESDDLVATCGLEDEWERIVMVGAVAALVVAKDLSPLEQQYLSERLANEAAPIGSATRIWSALRAWRRELLDRAQEGMRSREPVTVVTRDPF